MMRRFNTETRRVERGGGLGSWEQVKGAYHESRKEGAKSTRRELRMSF